MKLIDFHIQIHSFTGTNAPTERIFSQMNAIWTKQRSELNVKRIASMELVKYNTNQSCVEFYQSIKENPAVLTAIKSGEKYQKSQVNNQQIPPLQLNKDSSNETNDTMPCCEEDEFGECVE